MKVQDVIAGGLNERTSVATIAPSMDYDLSLIPSLSR